MARKLLHIPSIDERALQKEVLAITRLCGPDTHPNIVQVLNHDMMSNAVVYFIDMELCDLSLHEFVHCESSEGIPYSITSLAQNPFLLWDIMSQISNGVEYIHHQGQVHRDIKPRNSISLCIPYN